jgi:lysyl-tRNA synthetase class 2
MPSTVIAHFTYASPKSELVVTFRSGKRYAYVGVPPNVYEDFLRAGSKGRYFSLHIRDRYPTRRLPPDDPELVSSPTLRWR